jgi:hypothetical protein
MSVEKAESLELYAISDATTAIAISSLKLITGGLNESNPQPVESSVTNNILLDYAYAPNRQPLSQAEQNDLQHYSYWTGANLLIRSMQADSKRNLRHKKTSSDQ